MMYSLLPHTEGRVWWLLAIGVLFAATASIDLFVPLGVVAWLLYLIPIWLLSRLVPFDARLVVGGAIAATLLITLIFALSAPSVHTWIAASNRTIGIGMIWIVSTLLVRGRRQAQALAASEAQFRASFESAAVGQAQLDAATGRFSRVNDRFCDITGFERDELLGLTPKDLTHPDDVITDQARLSSMLRGEIEEYHSEKRYIRKDGDIRWVRLSARLIRDAAGRPNRTIAVVEDVTERKDAEAALMRLTMDLERRVTERTKALTDSQDRLRALTTELNLTERRERRRLAGDLHDYLAQLLVVCRMKLSQALRKVDAPEAKAAIGEADEVLDRSLTYTRSLVSQLEPPVLEQFGLPTALAWLAEEMRRYELQVQVDRPEERPPLSHDQAGLLFQSVRELLMNVVKHAKSPRARIALEQKEDRLFVSVQDWGVGFDPAGPVETAVDKFGLFSIRERMRALGGALLVTSIPGQGTTATLTLPLTIGGEQRLASGEKSSGSVRMKNDERRGSSPTTHHPPLVTDQKNGTIRVLLVDDHAMVREGLRSLMQAYPEIEVVGEAGNGEEAVASAGDLYPHVVVMDVNMPVLGGIEATERITETRPGTVIIGLSVNASPRVQEAMKEAGAAALLSKESAAESLCRTILELYAESLRAPDVSRA